MPGIPYYIWQRGNIPEIKEFLFKTTLEELLEHHSYNSIYYIIYSTLTDFQIEAFMITVEHFDMAVLSKTENFRTLLPHVMGIFETAPKKTQYDYMTLLIALHYIILYFDVEIHGEHEAYQRALTLLNAKYSPSKVKKYLESLEDCDSVKSQYLLNILRIRAQSGTHTKAAVAKGSDS